MSKFKNWINGFRKINYNIELEDKWDMSEDTRSRLKYLELISASKLLIKVNKNNVNNISDVNMMVLDFEVSRVRDTLLTSSIREHWESEGNSDSITNVSVTVVKRKPINERYITMKTVVFFLGLDLRIWKMRVVTRCSYNCRSSMFDSDVRHSLLIFTNEIIDLRNIKVMTKNNVLVSNIEDFRYKDYKTYESQIINYNNTPMIKNIGKFI